METNDTKYKKQWEETLNKIKEQIGTQMYYTLFSKIQCIDFKDNEICLSVPNTSIKYWLEKNYLQLIKDIVIQQFGLESDILIKFNTISAFGNKLNSGKRENKKDISHIEYEKTGLNPEYTFDNFVAGYNNNFARAASMAVAQSPAKSYNPLFIYSEDRSVRLHLMHAIGNYIFEKNSNCNIYFITAEKFTNELINAIRNDSNEAFREKYRNFDVLLIYDIQFLAGKERTQEEFFHIFNTLYNAGKQIVITSDRPPKDITNFEGRLISRFEWGLLADIPPPDF